MKSLNKSKYRRMRALRTRWKQDDNRASTFGHTFVNFITEIVSKRRKANGTLSKRYTVGGWWYTVNPKETSIERIRLLGSSPAC